MRAIFGAAMMAAAVLPGGLAHATGGLECTAVEDPEVVASILTSRLSDNVLMPLRASIAAGGRSFATEPQAGDTEIILAHSYGDARSAIVEYVDANAERVLVSLRLVRGATAEDFAEAGVLVVEGVGAWAVTCLEG